MIQINNKKKEHHHKNPYSSKITPPHLLSGIVNLYKLAELECQESKEINPNKHALEHRNTEATPTSDLTLTSDLTSFTSPTLSLQIKIFINPKEQTLRFWKPPIRTPPRHHPV
jgi:hypothetical protein